MTNIFACIDGSPAMTAVCDAAAWAAANNGLPVTLLHVLEKNEYEGESDLSGAIGLGSREQLLEELAELDHRRSRLAQEQGAEVVLITDRWMSPAAGHARHVLACAVEVPAAWDSTASILVVIEALLAQVQGLLADQVQARLSRLEDLFARIRVFRAPKVGGKG
mgnify:CR=1 FL=1